VNQGAISDESPRNLQEQLLLQDAKAGNCRVIHCGTDRLLGMRRDLLLFRVGILKIGIK
jgi:hypothetical protein